MERLTERTPAGMAKMLKNYYYADGKKDYIAMSARIQEVIERLAAYEDTGLEPE